MIFLLPDKRIPSSLQILGQPFWITEIILLAPRLHFHREILAAHPLDHLKSEHIKVPDTKPYHLRVLSRQNHPPPSPPNFCVQMVEIPTASLNMISLLGHIHHVPKTKTLPFPMPHLLATLLMIHSGSQTTPPTADQALDSYRKASECSHVGL